MGLAVQSGASGARRRRQTAPRTCGRDDVEAVPGGDASGALVKKSHQPMFCFHPPGRAHLSRLGRLAGAGCDNTAEIEARV
eukprot:scaffold1548_cov117-Isochrysis_galbana.AAC.7